MSLPSPPQYQPKRIKEIKNTIMSETLFTTLKKKYNEQKNKKESKDDPANKESLSNIFRSDIFTYPDPDSKIRKHTR
jgi:hypothetical protein